MGVGVLPPRERPEEKLRLLRPAFGASASAVSFSLRYRWCPPQRLQTTLAIFSPILAITTCQTWPHRPQSASISCPTPGVGGMAPNLARLDLRRIAIFAKNLPEDPADLPEGGLVPRRLEHGL